MAGAAVGGFTIGLLLPLIMAVVPAGIAPIVAWTATQAMGTGPVVKLLESVQRLLKAIASHWHADHPTCPQPPSSTEGAASAPVSPSAGSADDEGVVECFKVIQAFEEALACNMVSLLPAAIPDRSWCLDDHPCFHELHPALLASRSLSQPCWHSIGNPVPPSSRCMALELNSQWALGLPAGW